MPRAARSRCRSTNSIRPTESESQTTSTAALSTSDLQPPSSHLPLVPQVSDSHRPPAPPFIQMRSWPRDVGERLACAFGRRRSQDRHFRVHANCLHCDCGDRRLETSSDKFGSFILFFDTRRKIQFARARRLDLAFMLRGKTWRLRVCVVGRSEPARQRGAAAADAPLRRRGINASRRRRRRRRRRARPH